MSSPPFDRSNERRDEIRELFSSLLNGPSRLYPGIGQGHRKVCVSFGPRARVNILCGSLGTLRRFDTEDTWLFVLRDDWWNRVYLQGLALVDYRLCVHLCPANSKTVEGAECFDGWFVFPGEPENLIHTYIIRYGGESLTHTDPMYAGELLQDKFVRVLRGEAEDPKYVRRNAPFGPRRGKP